MSDAARQRLVAERKALAASRPVGCWARPKKAKDGSIDLFNWEAAIVPRAASAYTLTEGETLRLTFAFSPEYPLKAPAVSFTPPIFHTNVFKDGRVCLSLLLEKGHHADAVEKHCGHWVPSLTISDLLTAMTTFLDEPNPQSIANDDACALLKRSKHAYEAEVRKRMAAYRP